MKHRILFLAACLLASMVSWAEGIVEEPSIGATFKVGKLYYKVTSMSPRTVKVVRNTNNMYTPYSGEISIPNKVTYGSAPFSWTYNVTAISADAFSNKDTLDVLRIPSSVVEIERSAFGYRTAARQLVIEDGDEDLVVHNYSFYAFSVMGRETYIGRSLIFADSSDGGSKSTFANSSLGNVTIGPKVKTLDNYVFCGTWVSRIEIPEGLETIGMKTFEGCGFTSIRIPSSVTSIGRDAFRSCTSLKKVVMADGNENLNLGEWTTFDSYNGYGNSYTVDTLYLGRNLSGNISFGHASIKHLVIAEGVNGFPVNNEFYGVSDLQSVIVFWDNSETVNNTGMNSNSLFSGEVYHSAKLYVPGGTLSIYQNAKGWKQFENILPKSYKVTVEASAGGVVTMNNAMIVSDGKDSLWVKRETDVLFDIAEEDGNDVKSITMNGVNVMEQMTDGCFTIENLSTDVVLEVEFAPLPRYSVIASSSIGGSVIVANNTVISGRSTTVTLTADEGHELKSITVNGVDRTSEVVEGVLTLSDIQENQTVAATFQKLRFTVTAAECENGSIELSVTEVEWGDDMTMTLVPAEHYEVATVSVNEEDMTALLDGNKLIVTDIRQNTTLTATFQLQTFTVSETHNEGGSVSLSASAAQWSRSVTVTIAPDDEHYLAGVTVNGVEVTESVEEGQYTITVEEDIVVAVTFVTKPFYSVTATASTGGTAVVESESVMMGRSTSVTMSANEGFELANVTVNGVDKTNEVVEDVLTISNIQQNTSVAATFQKLRYTITVSGCEGGSILLSNNNPEWSDDVTITIVPDEDYELSTLIVNGIDVTNEVEDLQYTILNVREVMEVSATFNTTVTFISISSYGESTYCCDHDLDFSDVTGLKAYIASGYYPSTGIILLTRIYEVPAGTGIMVKGEQGTYKVPFSESSAYYVNMFVGTLAPTSIDPTDGNYTNYYLTTGSTGFGFYKVSKTRTMSANRAYLQLPTSLVNRNRNNIIKLAFEDEVNGITEIEAERGNNVVYDLQGRRIDSQISTPGIYIINNRKIFIR